MAAAVLNVAPEGNLLRYLQQIRQFPMLTPQEELSLAQRRRKAVIVIPYTGNNLCASPRAGSWPQLVIL